MKLKMKAFTGTTSLTRTVRWVLLSILGYLTLCGGTTWALDKTSREKFLKDKESHWEITARKLSYDEKKSLYVAEGDVVISRLGQTLYAQKATYDQKTGVAEVSGDVRFEAYGDILTGEHGTFNLRDSTGEMTKGRLFLHENNFYVSSDSVKKIGPNTYVTKNCRLTTCDGDKPDWSITAKEVEVTLEGYGTIKGGAFRVRDFPIFYLPWARFSAKTERSSGFLLPRGGYSQLNGWAGEIPFFWAISDQMDATFYQRVIEKRGYMQGLEYRYIAENNSQGTFLLDMLSDKIETKNMQNPNEINLSPFDRTNKTRYWARGRMDQQLPYDIRAHFDADYVSDQDYLREFTTDLKGVKVRPDLQDFSGRPVEEMRSPLRRSAMRLSRDREDYSLQGIGSYYQRPENPPFDMTPQPLAGANFVLLPKSFAGAPLYFNLETNYDYVVREFGPKGHRFHIGPGVSYPFFFGNYLQFEPSLKYFRTMQWLEGNPTGVTYQSRDVYELGARLTTILSRVFPYSWRDVTALKHKIRPSLTYQYRVPKDQDKFQPWFEPVDVEDKVNRVTLAIENFLDSRSDNKKKQEPVTSSGELSRSLNPTTLMRQGETRCLR